MRKKRFIAKLATVFTAALLVQGAASSFAFAASDPLVPNWSLDQAINSMRSDWLGGTVKKEQMTGHVKDFYLHVEEFETELTDGVKVKAWGYGLEGKPATVPGPTLRVKKGDLVRLHIRNNTTQPHSLHSHGITSLDTLDDGVPHITGAYIMPGKTMTYQYVAKEAGTHWYHCHVQTSLHQDMGMYGALIVEDTKKPTWDKEFVEMVDEWDTHRDPSKPAEKPNYNYFVVNGKAGTSVPDLHIKPGEIARVRLINAGFETHSLHLHGTHFVITHKDGYQLPSPINADTLNIAPGETYDVLVKGRDGVWPWHDHNSLDATNDGVYPGGMLMHVRGDGDNKFDPTNNPPRIPLEGHIHQTDPHALISEGDPQFIMEKIAYNGQDWWKASAKVKKQLHEMNTYLAKSIGGVYTKKGWVFPDTNFMGDPKAAEAAASAPAPATTTPAATPVAAAVSNDPALQPAKIELNAMKPRIVTDKAVGPDKTPGEAVAFNPLAPAQPPQGKVVEVHLEAKKAMMEVAPGDKREVWTFNGQVPAPIIRVHQGDTLKITLTNKDPDMEHGLDFHAGQMDMGTYHQTIKPGQSETFEFKTNYPGLFYYHCSAAPVIMHIANGMFGAVIVDPPGYTPSGKEYVVIQNEWYKTGASIQDLQTEKPVAVALNGVANQYVNSPLTAKKGENVRFYFVNAGINDFSAWHVIGQIFDTIEMDGNPKNKRTGVQTVLVPPGGTVVTDLTAPDPGTYLMLTHQMNEATKGGAGVLKVE
jgi:copper-containing nitrite reductase